MKFEFTEEQIAKATEAKSAEELKELAKSEGIELTDEQARFYFASLNSEEADLSDEELENVVGGTFCMIEYKKSITYVVKSALLQQQFVPILISRMIAMNLLRYVVLEIIG